MGRLRRQANVVDPPQTSVAMQEGHVYVLDLLAGLVHIYATVHACAPRWPSRQRCFIAPQGAPQHGGRTPPSHACAKTSTVALGAVSLLSACMLYTQHIRRPPRIPQSCPNRSSAIVHHCMHPHSSILREAYRMHVERFVVHSRRAPRLPFLRHVGSAMPCMHNSCPRCTDVARMHGVHV